MTKIYLGIKNENIPGTILNRANMGGVTGLEFLKKIFFITDGIMLAQVREISGVDGTTLQNWVKRGWVLNPINKTYNIDMLARILIINMMRDTVQLSRISFLLRFINGEVGNKDDDIIPESKLYDYICTISDRLTDEHSDQNIDINEIIEECIQDYSERLPGDRARLVAALEIIITAFYTSMIKHHIDGLLKNIENNNYKKTNVKKVLNSSNDCLTDTSKLKILPELSSSNERKE